MRTIRIFFSKFIVLRETMEFDGHLTPHTIQTRPVAATSHSDDGRDKHSHPTTHHHHLHRINDKCQNMQMYAN